MHIILKPQAVLHALEYYYNLHFKPPRTGEEVHLLGPCQPTPVRCTRSPHLLSDVVLAWVGNFNGPTGSRVLQQTPLKPAGLQGREGWISHTPAQENTLQCTNLWVTYTKNLASDIANQLLHLCSFSPSS